VTAARCLVPAFDLVARKVVDNTVVAGLQRRQQGLDYLHDEVFAIVDSVEDGWRRQAIGSKRTGERVVFKWPSSTEAL
jgi:hypothetical protein